MVPELQGWSVALVGHWNPMIFTPSWVIGRLTSSKQINLEYLLGSPTPAPGLQFDDIRLGFSNGTLVVSPTATEDALVQRVELVAVNVLNELPHTPLSGVGVNFAFLVPAPEGRLAKVFSLSDQGHLADARVVVHNTQIKRRLLQDDIICNLSMTWTNEDRVRIDLNYHADVANPEAAAKFLEGKVIDYKNRGLRLLEAVYDVTLETAATEEKV
jgi:hypothetical protein